jgi:multiple sugar transport system ATP-binding protein
LRKGRLQQLDTPQRLYEAPVNLFVDSFIGSPEMNLLQCRLGRQNGNLVVQIAEQVLELPPGILSVRPGLERFVGATIGLGIRPEHVHDARLENEVRGRTLRGSVQLTEVLGSELLVHLAVAAERVRTAEVLEVARDVDVTLLDEIVGDAQSHQTPFVGRLDTRSTFEIDDVVEISVDTEKMHFFDLETGLAIYEQPRDEHAEFGSTPAEVRYE